MSAVLTYIANAFLGTVIQKFVDGLLEYFERAKTISQAKDLGTAEQVIRDQEVVADAQAQINTAGSERRETEATKKALRDGTF